MLTSSWRIHWDKEPHKRDSVGKELDGVFKSAGLEIFDKTAHLDSRCDEIKAWLNKNPNVKKFVIIDDRFGGWEDLALNVVKTNMRVGRGLEDLHVEKAISILNQT